MAMTELVLIWMGSVAVLASAGMFMPMDGFTELVLPFVAAFLWAIVSIGATDVIPTANDSLTTVEIQPLFWLAGAFSMCSLVLGIYVLIRKPAEEVDAATEGVDL